MDEGLNYETIILMYRVGALVLVFMLVILFLLFAFVLK
jgi:hypothetical protein